MEMTPRERVFTASRRQIPDKVPKWIDHGSFAPLLMAEFHKKTGASKPEEYFDYDIRQIGFGPSEKKPDIKKYIPSDIPRGAFVDWDTGNVQMRGIHGNVVSTIHYALEEAETVKDIEDYPIQDFSDKYQLQLLKEKVIEIKRRNLASMGMMGATIFERAWNLRGFENFLIDMVLRKDMANLLLDKITELRCRQAEIMAEARVDILRLGDDVGTEHGMMLSLELWREMLKSRLGKVIKKAKEIKPDIIICFHSDGDCREVIPELIEIGVDILNPVQPECMDPAEIKKLFGDKLAFHGTIGTQTTMPFGTPDDVKKVVKERIETVGIGGGFLIGPTHLLQDEVPFENVLAFFEAVEKYGYYI